jgi:hypothetical protein
MAEDVENHDNGTRTALARSADTLERQAAENKRLRRALKKISRASYGGPFYSVEALQNIAGAALTGEDAGGKG